MPPTNVNKPFLGDAPLVATDDVLQSPRLMISDESNTTPQQFEKLPSPFSETKFAWLFIAATNNLA
jgi:hypothetical protein